jgi:hypothetical protein
LDFEVPGPAGWVPGIRSRPRTANRSGHRMLQHEIKSTLATGGIPEIGHIWRWPGRLLGQSDAHSRRRALAPPSPLSEGVSPAHSTTKGEKPGPDMEDCWTRETHRGISGCLSFPIQRGIPSDCRRAGYAKPGIGPPRRVPLAARPQATVSSVPRDGPLRPVPANAGKWRFPGVGIVTIEGSIYPKRPPGDRSVRDWARPLSPGEGSAFPGAGKKCG